MPILAPLRDEPWLTRSLSVGKSAIVAAGLLRNVAGLDPNEMRVLGSFGLIYMVHVDGYYGDERGTAAALRSGDVVWIHPGVAHAYGPREGTEWAQIYVVLEGAQWEQWAQDGVWDLAHPVTHAEPVDYWRRRFEEVFAGGEGPERIVALRTMGRLLQVMTDLLATHAEALRSPADAWLERSQLLLGERPVAGAMGLTPQDVARRVGLSYENFRKQFAAHFGVSPGQYQKRRRIEHACAAIYQGEHSFKALAEELGFCDVFHFSKAFKQVVGDTPSDFRRKARGR